jgi:hypothetical protein
LGCRFFFGEVRAAVDAKFPNLSGGGGDPKSTIAAKNTISGYGWLNSLYDVAKDGVFTVVEYNPIDSVLNTKLFEVLTYLSWKAACSDFEKQLNDLYSKK